MPGYPRRYNFLALSVIAMAFALALNNYRDGNIDRKGLISKNKNVIACNTSGLAISEKNWDLTNTGTGIASDGSNKCPHSSGKQGTVCALTVIRRRFMKLASC